MDQQTVNWEIVVGVGCRGEGGMRRRSLGGVGLKRRGRGGDGGGGGGGGRRGAECKNQRKWVRYDRDDLYLK